MSQEITSIKPREFKLVEDNGPLANLLDTARFEHMIRIAGLMAGASLIPDHLWKNTKTNEAFTPEQVKANCFLIVNQALRWGIDPFAAAPETYVVGGKLGFQGKLVAAIINYRAPIESNLAYSYTGKGDDLTITVSATIKGETEPRTVTLSVGQAKTGNQMWTKDLEQKLVYSGATKWARRHCPEVILGVLTDDDIEKMNEDSALKTAKPVYATKETTITEDAPKSDKKQMFEKKAKVLDAPKADATVAAEAKTQDNPAAKEPERLPADTDETRLIALMEAEKPPITAEELGRILKSFNKSIPRKFTGPGDLTDEILAETIKEWAEYRSIILGERGASAP